MRYLNLLDLEDKERRHLVKELLSLLDYDGKDTAEINKKERMEKHQRLDAFNKKMLAERKTQLMETRIKELEQRKMSDHSAIEENKMNLMSRKAKKGSKMIQIAKKFYNFGNLKHPKPSLLSERTSSRDAKETKANKVRKGSKKMQISKKFYNFGNFKHPKPSSLSEGTSGGDAKGSKVEKRRKVFVARDYPATPKREGDKLDDKL